MHRPRSIATALVLGAALTLSACSGGGDGDDPVVSETPSGSPSPTFAIQPVIGERIPTVTSLSTGVNLGLGDPTPPDDDAINAAIDAVGDHLDQHLDTLQRDGEGTLDEFAADGLLDSGDIASVTTDLASPQLPVAAAHYTLSAYHDGAPQWITARVEVTRADDSVALATMTFYVSRAGNPVLTMFGPEEPQQEEEA